MPYVILAHMAQPNMARLSPSALLLLMFLQIWDTRDPRYSAEDAQPSMSPSNLWAAGTCQQTHTQHAIHSLSARQQQTHLVRALAALAPTAQVSLLRPQ